MKFRFRHFQSFALGIAATALVTAPCFAATSSTTSQGAWKHSSWRYQKLISANASLVQALNSQHVTQGQTVTAKLTSAVKSSGSTEMPHGTMLIGKVTQVEMSKDGGPAKIGILFNEARLKSGREFPIKATLLAAYPPAEPYAETGDGSYLPQQPHYIAANSKVLQEPGPLGHVTMQSAVQSKLSGVFTSKDREIHLRRGTRLQLAIAPEASATAHNG